MDFMERLNDTINSIEGLPERSRLGYLGTDESLVLYPLPGSRPIVEYMDGTRDEQLNYEISMKSKSQDKINKTLWLVARTLEGVKSIVSLDNSFEFQSLTLTNMPYVNSADEQGWYTFNLNVQAIITNKEKERLHGTT